MDMCMFAHLAFLFRSTPPLHHSPHSPFSPGLDAILARVRFCSLFFPSLLFLPESGSVIIVAFTRNQHLTIEDGSSRRTGYSSRRPSSDASRRPSEHVQPNPPSCATRFDYSFTIHSRIISIPPFARVYPSLDFCLLSRGIVALFLSCLSITLSVVCTHGFNRSENRFFWHFISRAM